MKQSIKKIVAISLAFLVGVTLAGGWIFSAVNNNNNLEQQNSVLSTGLTTAQNLADEQAIVVTEQGEQIEALKTQFKNLNGTYFTVVSERDAMILADAEAEQERLDAELATEAEAALESEEYDGLILGADVDAKTFNDDDLSFLKDSKFEFDGDKYDYSEEIVIDGVRIGLGSTDDVDFEDNAYLLFAQKGAVNYVYNFDDEFDYTTITEDETLEINFLGNDIEIVSMDANEFTYKTSEATQFMKVGDVFAYNGHNVTLTDVADGDTDSAIVNVDGMTKAIDEGDSEKFGDFEINAKNVIVGQSTFTAELEFGNDILQTIEDGDEYIVDNENFVWNFETDGDILKSLSITYDVKADDLDEDILAIGDELNFADYFGVQFSLESDGYSYVKYTIGFDEVTDADVPVMYFETNNNDIKVGNEKVSKAYFDGTNSYYKDGKDWVIGDDVIELENDDIILEVGFADNKVSFGDFKLRTLDFKSLGVEGDAEDNDVKYDGDNIGTVDESLMFPDGFIVESIQDNAEEDEFVFQMPNEEVKGVIRVVQK